MKITEEVLLAMGASKPAHAVPSYTLCIADQTFTLREQKGTGHWLFKRTQEFPTHHHITDVEEMIQYAFEEGVREGQANTQKAMRGVLGLT